MLPVVSVMLMSTGLRFGLLPLAQTVYFSEMPVPFITDVSAWYAKAGWMQAALTLGPAVWAFRNSLGGRKAFQSSPLDG